MIVKKTSCIGRFFVMACFCRQIVSGAGLSRVVGDEHARRQAPFRYHSVTLPEYIGRRCRIKSCDVGHSLKCTLKYVDQSTICEVAIVWSVARRRIGIVLVYAVVVVETLGLVHADNKKNCHKLHYSYGLKIC